MKKNDGIDDDMKFLAKSEIRLKILSELNENPNTVRGLVKDTNITYSSISSNIGKLEKNKLISKIENHYHVNPMTKVYFKTLMEFKESLDLISNYDEFWNKHNLNQLSISSIRRITYLKNSQLVETTPIDIYKTHNTIKKQIMSSTNINAIFPYLHPEYPKLLEKALRNNGNVELIVPKSISKEIMHRVNKNIRKNAIKNDKLKVYVFKKDLNLYLTVCDKSMSLGLFKNDGSFDQNRILISDDEKSNKWARELFEHVKDQVKQ